MQSNKTCQICGELGHSKFYCKNKPIKPVLRKATKQRKPVVKKVSRSKVKKVLDKLVKDSIKERDNYTCQRCGKKVDGSNCHASHVMPVGSHACLQFDPLNLKVLCYHDHINWWHKNPIEAGEWFKSKFPERWAYLQEQARLNIKKSTPELQEMIASYTHPTKNHSCKA